ncbi:ABC transporter ATP-binding protein [Bacillus sp. FJAT-29937]|uniref:ABC transporter ATP-binding protein n=1 Tax=Bacillus sp. FJAT-29937 TaxID=1720553 RepID=UPI00082ADC3E|nr:ABC transporter ATP-binding protein [Bacillus sp. FJAT-29937]
MGDSLKKLLLLFNKREKRKLIMIFLMIIFAALFETLGIGLIVPFVEIVTKPSVIFEHKSLFFIYELFGFKSTTTFLIFSALLLLLVFVLKNLYLLFFQYIQTRVVLNQQARLSARLYKSYLNKPYTFHLQKNTADLLRNVHEEVRRVLQNIIMSSFLLITEILVITCILVLLLTITPIATIVATILLGGSVFLFFKIFRKKLNELGKKHQVTSGRMIKWINQGLGASKEIKVMGKENFFVSAYTKQSKNDAKINRFRLMLEQTPRLFLETIIVSIVMITMLIVIFQANDASQLVSTMALFAMAAFRLLPSLNRVMAMSTTIRFSLPALEVVYEDLITNQENELPHSNLISDPTSNCSNMDMNNNIESIKLANVSFRYPNQTEYSIRDISLSIPIGHSVAFIGQSGAGKTTLIDIILGVLQPEKGKVLVNGKNINDVRSIWQTKIGYIPQSIFLSDDSIRGNVAFGIDNEQTDDEEVWKALEQAQLKDFVEGLPNKLDSFVGERGIRLSGGQRQRVGIARALYHNPEILFMDEATSALDNETEKEIMKAIDSLKGEKTVIIIAHRLTTIENCDLVYEINNGKLLDTIYKQERSVISSV